MSATGLGGFDPFARREQAAAAFIPPPPPPDDDLDDEVGDQGNSENQKASNNASNSDSVDPSRDQQGGASVGSGNSANVLDVPAPPPTREVKGRTQMNARVKVDRMRALKRYQNKHGATFQAVVDQMVDEYLDRRGLLPKDSE